MTVVEHLRPRAVLIENVPELPRWDDGAVLIGFYEALRELGYDVDARVLDAYRHGVPQHRARLFIVGIRDGAPFEWPEPATPSTRPCATRSATCPRCRPPSARSARVYLGEPTAALQRRLRRDLPRGRAPARLPTTSPATCDPTTPRRSACSARGRPTATCPTRLQRYRTDIFDDKYKRLAWDEVSRIDHRPHRQGRLLVHPSRAAPHALGPRGGADPDLPRPVPLRRRAQPPLPPDRQRGPAAAGRGARASDLSGAREPPSPARPRDRDRLARATCSPGTPTTRAASRGGASGLSPWQVLMAEMCLHRTRADQVAPVFERAAAAGARPPRRWSSTRTEALEAMRSLGLRWRAENIIEVARALVDGLRRPACPTPSSSCARCPGVGDYVAQAVLCFGFGRRAVLVDTNTARIVGRLHDRDDTRRWQLRLDLHRLAGPRRAGRRVQLRAAGSRRAGLPRRHAALRRVPGPAALRHRRRGRAAAAAPARARRHERAPTHRTVIPSARRLMDSLRDIGYDLPAAVADLVDNSIDADARNVDVAIGADGADSWIRVADDGIGMTARELDEAMRYGSDRALRRHATRALRARAQDRLAEPVPPADRRDPDHAPRADRDPPLGPRSRWRAHDAWELERLTPARVPAPSCSTRSPAAPGTVVLWERLDRVLGYRRPDGARRDGRLEALAERDRASTSRWSSTASSPASCGGRRRDRGSRVNGARARARGIRSPAPSRQTQRAATSDASGSHTAGARTGSRSARTSCPNQIQFSSAEAHAARRRARDAGTASRASTSTGATG